MSILLTKLTTVNDHLPQGAPTSTTLANLVLHLIGGPIRIATNRLRIRYSAWIDDLVFSGSNARLIIPIVASTLNINGFKLSRKKLKVQGGGKRKSVNGLVLGSEPHLPREYLSKVSSGIYHLEIGAVPLEFKEKYELSLRGRINHVLSISKKQGERLKVRFEAVTR
jgi:hypothetical protein